MWWLTHSGQIEEAIAIGDDLLTRFESETDEEDLEHMPDALLKASTTFLTYKPFHLFRTGLERKRRDHGLRMLRVIAARLGQATDPTLRKLAVHAELKTSIALARRGRTREATAKVNEVLNAGAPALVALAEIAESAAKSDRRDMHEQMLLALVGRALVLDQLGRQQESVAALKDLTDRFRKEESPIGKVLLATARKQLRDASAR